MITTSLDQYRVQPGSRVELAKWDADDKRAFDGSKKDGKEALHPRPHGLAPSAGLSTATVRFSGVKYFAATALTSSGVMVASTRGCSST